MEWRSIKGFEGLYEVNDQGEVRSLPRKRKHISRIKHNISYVDLKGRILKPGKDAIGYYHYILNRDGKSHLFKAHHLVAQAFLGYDREMWATTRIYVKHINRR